MSELSSMEVNENINTGNALISAITEYAYSKFSVALVAFDQFSSGPSVNIVSKERVKIPFLSSWWIFSKLQELETAGEKFCLNSLASHSGVKVQKITQTSSWTIRLLLSKPFLNNKNKVIVASLFMGIAKLLNSSIILSLVRKIEIVLVSVE